MSLTLSVEISEYTRKFSPSNSESRSENGDLHNFTISWPSIFDKLKHNRTIFHRDVLSVFLINVENQLKNGFTNLLEKVHELSPRRALSIIDLFWKHSSCCEKDILIEQTMNLLSTIHEDGKDFRKRKDNGNRLSAVGLNSNGGYHHGLEAEDMDEYDQIYYLRICKNLHEEIGTESFKKAVDFDFMIKRWHRFFGTLAEDVSAEYINQLADFTNICLAMDSTRKSSSDSQCSLAINFASTSIRERPPPSSKRAKTSSESSGFESSEVHSEIQSKIKKLRQESVESNGYSEISTSSKYLCSQRMAVNTMNIFHNKLKTARAKENTEMQIHCERELREIVKCYKYPEILSNYYKIYKKLPPVARISNNAFIESKTGSTNYYKQTSSSSSKRKPVQQNSVISKDYLSPKTLLLLDIHTLKQLIPALFHSGLNSLIFENRHSLSSLGAHLVGCIPVLSKQVEKRIDELQDMLVKDALTVLKSVSSSELKTSAIRKFIIGICHSSWNLPQTVDAIKKFSCVQVNLEIKNPEISENKVFVKTSPSTGVEAEVMIADCRLNLNKIEDLMDSHLKKWNVDKSNEFIALLRIMNALMFHVESVDYERLWDLSNCFFKNLSLSVLSRIQAGKLKRDVLTEIVEALPVNNKPEIASFYESAFNSLLTRSVWHGLRYFDRMFELDKKLACSVLTQDFMDDQMNDWPFQPEHPFLHKPIMLYFLNNCESGNLMKLVKSTIKCQISLCNLLTVYSEIEFDDKNRMHIWLKKLIAQAYKNPKNTQSVRKKLLEVASSKRLRDANALFIPESDNFMICQYKVDYMRKMATRCLPIMASNENLSELDLSTEYYYELVVHDPTLLPKYVEKIEKLGKLFAEVTGQLDVGCLSDILSNKFTIRLDTEKLRPNVARYKELGNF